MTEFNVELMQKQFFCCTPLKKFKWPNCFDDISQKDVIEATVNHNVVLMYPIKPSYRKAFLKLLINKLEETGHEIDDEVYNIYCDIMARPDEPASMHYRHFMLNKHNNSTISLKESTNIISKGTTGLCSWKAAFNLSEWCIFNRERIVDKNILELGSGVGLTGLAVVNSCAPRMYYFSDCHPVVLKTLEDNVRLNLLEKCTLLWKEVLSENRILYKKEKPEKPMDVQVLNFNWENIDKLDLRSMKLNLVIAADILYDNRTFESLALCLKKLLSSTVEYAIIAATIRNETTVSKFLGILDKNDLAFEEETASTSKIFIQSEDTPVRILKIFKQSE